MTLRLLNGRRVPERVGKYSLTPGSHQAKARGMYVYHDLVKTLRQQGLDGLVTGVDKVDGEIVVTYHIYEDQFSQVPRISM